MEKHKTVGGVFVKQKELMLGIIGIGLVYIIAIWGLGFSSSSGAPAQSGQPGGAVAANPSTGDSGASGASPGTGGEDAQPQEVYVKALSTGSYDKAEVQVKAGVPVRFHFTADPGAGCGRQLVIPDFGVRLVSQGGEEQVATFTPATPGRYAYRCGMNMFRGVLVVS